MGIGTGQNNTKVIISQCEEENIAAKICDNLVLNGYNDWFLPSIFELNEIFCRLGSDVPQEKAYFYYDWAKRCGEELYHSGKSNIGNFKSRHYWSSTDSSEYYSDSMFRGWTAWVQNLITGSRSESSSKNNEKPIRCIRAF